MLHGLLGPVLAAVAAAGLVPTQQRQRALAAQGKALHRLACMIVAESPGMRMERWGDLWVGRAVLSNDWLRTRRAAGGGAPWDAPPSQL